MFRIILSLFAMYARSSRVCMVGSCPLFVVLTLA